MGVLNGMEDLGLVHMTAEGMANSGVAKGAKWTVEEEGVAVKGQEVIKFGQLQNVDTPRWIQIQDIVDAILVASSRTN